MFQANIVPGQGFVPFEVYEKTGGVSAKGRPVEGKYRKTDKQFLGIMVQASQKEIDQWKQNGHPITHKIIQYGALCFAKSTDYLQIPFVDNGGFYVQGFRNPGGLRVTNIYYVEERFDIKKELKTDEDNQKSE